MCGVIVVDAGRSHSTNLGRDAYIMDHCLDIVMIIWSFINCPTVIVFPPFVIFLREATSETYGPRGLFFITLLLISFSFAFVLRSIDLQNYNHFAAIFHRRFSLSSYRQGIDTPGSRWGARICFLVCRCWTRGVGWLSFWFDNLGS
jgi:hypothetical protein